MRIDEALNSHLIQWGLNVLYIFNDYVMIFRSSVTLRVTESLLPCLTNSVSKMWSRALMELPSQINNHRPMRQFVYISDVIGR